MITTVKVIPSRCSDSREDCLQFRERIGGLMRHRAAAWSSSGSTPTLGPEPPSRVPGRCPSPVAGACSWSAAQKGVDNMKFHGPKCDRGSSDPRHCGSDDTSLATALNSPEITPTTPRSDVVTVLSEVYQLLDDYAPAWYSEELHEKLTRTLQIERAAHAMNITRNVCF